MCEDKTADERIRELSSQYAVGCGAARSAASLTKSPLPERAGRGCGGWNAGVYL
ncbi:MAG: hypothetical protein AB9835_00860 [Eubacteriales bacterium]